jgi:ribosomal protein S18 acetylase RimI-like enzyme
MKIALEKYTPEVGLALRNGLHAYNVSKSNAEWEEIVVTVRDSDDVLHGGVIGQIYGDTCYIDTVWLDEETRRARHGTTMLQTIEEEVRRRPVKGVWLYTASYQAKPFYEKLGYVQFAELQWPGSDIVRHFMKKVF